MSGYDTQYGAGITTSSPGSMTREDQVEDRLLRAGRHQDLIALVLEAVLALELRDDRVFQLGGAFDRRVARVAFADRFDAGVGDVRRACRNPARRRRDR